jgi:hypothetical protein
MWLRRLMAMAVLAAASGLLASTLVRRYFTGIMSALSSPALQAEPVEPVRLDGGAEPARANASLEGSGTAQTGPTAQPVLAKGAPRSRRIRAARAAREPARDAFSRTLGHGIQKLGERRYEIRRDALELALHNLRALSASARVAPELRGGKPVGFRLFAVSADGPIAKLGLRDGDVLVSINGMDITTPDRVLSAYAKLKAADRLELGILREGRAFACVYVIH